MRTDSEAYDAVLKVIESKLCSGSKQAREGSWRRLVRTLRLAGCDPESPDAVAALVRGEPDISPQQRYHGLLPAERIRLHDKYAECLRAAKAEFPRVFYVQVVNVPTAAADVLLAERAPGSELPHLNADQKSLARAFGIPEKEYARSEAAKYFSEERYRFYAERCWDFLEEAARIHSVDAVDVIYDVSSERFYCELRQNGFTTRFFLDARLVAEPLQRGDRIGLDRARKAVRFTAEQALAARAGSTT